MPNSRKLVNINNVVRNCFPSILIVFVVIVAAFLRLYKLGQVPIGYTWDEAAITYNAWGIATWHRDEYANFMPVSFKSFGDYKAPLLIYALSVPFKLFGLHENLIRVYSAIAGIVAVILVYKISQLLLKKLMLVPAVSATKIALIASIFTTISPWHIHFSRAGYEANIALTLLLIGVWALLKAFNKPHYYSLGAISLIASMYAYHSTKIFVPIFTAAFILIYFRERLGRWKWWLPAMLLGIILSLPLAQDLIWGEGGTRAESLVIYDESGNLEMPSKVLQLVAQNTYSQLSPNFWISGADAASVRHSVSGHGVLYKLQFSLFLIGLGFLLKRIRKNYSIFLIGWVVIGIIPAVLGDVVPHSLRSLLALPAIMIISAIGWAFIESKIARIEVNTKLIFHSLLVFVLFAEFVSYIHAYYYSYALSSALDHQYGYKEAIAIAKTRGRHVNKVVITDAYGQPYIYTLLYRRITPQEFLFGALANYELRKINWPESTANTLYIATPEEINPDDSMVVETVDLPNGQPVFVVAQTPKN